ncbi:hypothetical protein CMUS01_02501 [Colletotrichum musicola]|uniref:Uncharacterized protein n=1 Tax=Colletotrichum musicola TaxID=2175873 RepID=A0A8H6NV34_9PEZI|nr:hypothetical protein CMUS01_02501 [Colletotrichum musicola]
MTQISHQDLGRPFRALFALCALSAPAGRRVDMDSLVVELPYLMNLSPPWNASVGLSSLPAIFAGSVADASATGAELRSSVSRSEHVTGLGAGLDIQGRAGRPALPGCAVRPGCSVRPGQKDVEEKADQTNNSARRWG